MNNGLASIVSRVRTGADSIAGASSQVASGNQDLSARTERQASFLEETVSSMQKLNENVKQNSVNAMDARNLSVMASEVAGKGGLAVSQVVEMMGTINESSKKIKDIVSVIDSIAFQTNILALNAAVEAARAGEEGRGFAVVAAEVRGLAHRCASAAKEIGGLISHSVDRVETGARMVDEAGKTMGEIVNRVKCVTNMIATIAGANQEQSNGLSQINDAIRQIDHATQENAALVEQSAAAAESMRNNATELAEMVSLFKLPESAAQPTTAL